jgi:hypothetical protein
MNNGVKIISIALLLLTGMESAFAGPWGRMHGGREEARAAHQQRREAPVERQQMQGGRAPSAAPLIPANVPGPAFPGGYGDPGRAGNMNRPSNQVRIFGPRMSVEERQQRRRQINEAGQDIYAPRK